MKVKEPQTSEYGFFRPGLILFTYLHLAPLPELTDKLVATQVNGVAYETIRERDGSLPLLTPMSEVAGRMACRWARNIWKRPNGGRGILLGGVPGVAPGNVVILGGGVVGTNAAKIAVGHGRARHHHRPQPEPPARTRRHLQRPGGHAGFQHLDDPRESEDCRSGDRRGADSGRFGAASWCGAR